MSRCTGCDKVLSDEELHQVYREEQKYWWGVQYGGILDSEHSPPRPACLDCRRATYVDVSEQFEALDFFVDFAVDEEEERDG